MILIQGVHFEDNELYYPQHILNMKINHKKTL